MTYKNYKEPGRVPTLREEVPEAARSVSADKERAEFLARAKAFDLLAEHCSDNNIPAIQ